MDFTFHRLENITWLTAHTQTTSYRIVFIVFLNLLHYCSFYNNYQNYQSTNVKTIFKNRKLKPFLRQKNWNKQCALFFDKNNNYNLQVWSITTLTGIIYITGKTNIVVTSRGNKVKNANSWCIIFIYIFPAHGF